MGDAGRWTSGPVQRVVADQHARGRQATSAPVRGPRRKRAMGMHLRAPRTFVRVSGGDLSFLHMESWFESGALSQDEFDLLVRLVARGLGRRPVRSLGECPRRPGTPCTWTSIRARPAPTRRTRTGRCGRRLNRASPQGLSGDRMTTATVCPCFASAIPCCAGGRACLRRSGDIDGAIGWIAAELNHQPGLRSAAIRMARRRIDEGCDATASFATLMSCLTEKPSSVTLPTRCATRSGSSRSRRRSSSVWPVR